MNNQNVVLLECSTLTPPLSSLIHRFSRVSWTQAKVHSSFCSRVNAPTRSFHCCHSCCELDHEHQLSPSTGDSTIRSLSIVARGFARIRTSSSSSSPGALHTSRTFVAWGYTHIQDSIIVAAWGYTHIQARTSSIDHFIARRLEHVALVQARAMHHRSHNFRLRPPLTTQQRSWQAVLHAVLVQAISRARFHQLFPWPRPRLTM